MNVDNDSLRRINSHWALLAVGEETRARALKVADARLVKQAVGQQIQISFSENSTDENQLHRVAMAYELAAIEGLPEIVTPSSDKKELRGQCAAGAWRAFEIIRLFPIPEPDKEKINHILHLSALAYCGERWSDLRRWYKENDRAIAVPSVAQADWSDRLLYRLFECWIRLFRKKRWDDLDRVREIISGLREDQRIYEAKVLDNGSNAEDRVMAFRLIGLYHWAKATELLAKYMLQGEPSGIASLLDKHFESAIKACSNAIDADFEVLLRWLHATSRLMVNGSIWWVASHVNSRVTRFVEAVTKQQALFELLPPQRAALQEQGLLDQAARAIVVDMPTSGGKTLLAKFRILQALNQFDVEHGWVAYVAPTRALTAQITRRLRKDFEPIGVKVEQLTGAVEIDTFEDDLLTKSGDHSTFDVLVATPEKLQLVIRNKKVPRPLALVVMDEAHNIENESRGLRIELLLATIKGEYHDRANFLLLMPYVEKAETLARWLADDVNAGRTISFGMTPWKPNERVVGIFSSIEDKSARGAWRLQFETLTTTPRTIHLGGKHLVDGIKPLNIARSKVTLSLEAAAMAGVLSCRGTSIAVANRINDAWNMARCLSESYGRISSCTEIKLVQKFLKNEISPRFELIDMLDHGIGVHHAGLSDETRALIEWLAEESKLRVLCTTTTIAQGINFPVSSVFLTSRFFAYGKEIAPRDFWNLAGRAGRMNQDSVGVVGIAAGDKPREVIEYINRRTGELVSRLVGMVDDLDKLGKLNDLETIIHDDQWNDFRCYVAHLWNEKKHLDSVLADTEQLLRNTYGYGMLRASENGKKKADMLLEVTKKYARSLADKPGPTQLADMTGFSPEGVAKALYRLGRLERKLTPTDWMPESLFGSSSGIAHLYGIMLSVPQLSENLKDLAGTGKTQRHLAEITNAWVNGKSIQEIAKAYFKDKEGQTKEITEACKAIYRNLVNTGTWGIAALTRISGIDFDALPEQQRRKINALPAMIYHGVKTEEAVLMRMNSIPRSIAESIGAEYKANIGDSATGGVRQAREYLKNMETKDWEKALPKKSALSGGEYREIWGVLAGERG
jgi:replicative superfamily II helicase